MWVIECPYCGYEANASEFEVSMADEAFCPRCEEGFLVDFESDEDEDEDDDEY